MISLILNLAAINSITAEDNGLNLHVIQSKEIQEIMQRLSLSVYDEALTMEQINELFDATNERHLAAKKLTPALAGFDLTETEKNIFENIARQLQIEANNLGYMAQNNEKVGMEIICP